MNRLSATPSLSETRRASSSSDVCSRSATLLSCLTLNLPPSLRRRRYEDSEVLRRQLEMTPIERHQAIRATIYDCRQNHLIRRILQLRPPKEAQLSWLRPRPRHSAKHSFPR